MEGVARGVMVLKVSTPGAVMGGERDQDRGVSVFRGRKSPL